MNRDFAVARRRMVREQVVGAGITDRRVIQAMEEVPRHLFVPKLLHHRAQQASALPIGFGQTISKPFTVGLMSALLELKGHEHVLEVGTGSGYQGAILAKLARTVLSVERITPLADRARQVLAQLGLDNITVLAHDGITGFMDQAPFDAIMVTACAPHLPPLLVSQLKDGGYLLIPVNKGREQILYRYQRRGEEVLVEQSVSCRFVPLLDGVTVGEEPADTPAPPISPNSDPQEGEHLA
jgi:protein-L-isoaspartate(D-aspartate) O-methyltransferase|nr:protein-L-isoaspartate(D-aspartate) O-methyltransferase [Candidatus Krumholzibacteria bacterium]